MNIKSSIKKFLFLAILPIMFFAFGNEAKAAEYYASFSSGNDVNPGTQAQPLKYHPWMAQYSGAITLQPGDTVYLKRGDSWIFSNPTAPAVEAKQSGTEGALIRTTAYGNSNRPIIKISTDTLQPVIEIIGKSYLKFDNLDIQHFTASYIGWRDIPHTGIYMERASAGQPTHHIWINDNEIHNCPFAGIYGFNDSHNIYIGDMNASQTATENNFSNEVHHCGVVGIGLLCRDAQTARSDFYVYHNYVHDITNPTCHTDAYGITFSGRMASQGCSGWPRYGYMRYNYVKNVPAWTCFDNHGGSHLYYEYNKGYNCPLGAGLGDNGADRGFPDEADHLYLRYNTIVEPANQICGKSGWFFIYGMQGVGAQLTNGEVVGNKAYFESPPNFDEDIVFLRIKGTDGLLVEGNEFWNGENDAGWGFYIADSNQGTTNLTIRNNKLTDIYEGMYFTANGITGPINIYNNLFKTHDHGLFVVQNNYPNSLKLFNNTFLSKNSPLYVPGIISSASIEMKNNIIGFSSPMAKEYFEFTGYNNGSFSSSNNLFFNSTLAGPMDLFGGRAVSFNEWKNLVNDIASLGPNANPIFADAIQNNYQLLSISPAINSGANVGINYDLDGKLRDSQPDIGAYEYAAEGGDTTPPSAPVGLAVN